MCARVLAAGRQLYAIFSSTSLTLRLLRRAPADPKSGRWLSWVKIVFGVVSGLTAGSVKGGDRLPWAPVPGADNFDSLRAPQWQVHIYGTARKDVSAWCDDHNVPLHQYAWHDKHAAAGFAKDALYLIRPDAYVALADPEQTSASLDRYFAEQQLSF